MYIIPWNITSPYPHVYYVEPEGSMLLEKMVPYLILCIYLSLVMEITVCCKFLTLSAQFM